MSERLTLHEYSLSGNCYKIRLTAALLDIPIERREYDILKGETRTPDFIANVNANGRIPVLQIGDRFIPESNAACYYLADDSSLVPSDRFDNADMLRWMFWEQYSHEPYVAVARFQRHYLGKEPEPKIVERGKIALQRLEDGLASSSFLVGETLSLADVALVAYTRVAHEGGFELADYPRVQAWIRRVETALKIPA